MAIDSQAEKVIARLAASEAAIGAAVASNGKRPWLDFQELQAVGKFDYAGLHALFSRQKSNDSYAKLAASPDSQSKELQTAKLSSDLLAGLERDWRMRQRSRIRLFAHAGARSSVAGNPAGPLVKHSSGWFSRILADDKVS